MNSYRQVALRLHGLDGRDRRWILARLERSQRARLKGMLRELKAMRIPQEDWHGAAAAIHQVQSTVQRTDAERKAGDVARAPSEAIAEVLSEEPAWLIGSVLSLRHWPWAENVAQQHDLHSSTYSARIKPEGDSKRPTAKVTQIMVLELARRLEEVTPGRAMQPRTERTSFMRMKWRR